MKVQHQMIFKSVQTWKTLIGDILHVVDRQRDDL
jgi:hypothetical protein